MPCLATGPPGTGKTLLARAVANNIDARFLKVVASAIVDKYIGESARMIREMFGLSSLWSLSCAPAWADAVAPAQVRQGPPALYHIHGRD